MIREGYEVIWLMKGVVKVAMNCRENPSPPAPSPRSGARGRRIENGLVRQSETRLSLACESDHGGVADRSKLTAERQTSRLAIDSEYRQVIAALIAANKPIP